MEYVDCVLLGNKGIGKHSLVGGFQDGAADEDELSLSLTIDKKKVDFVVKIVDETVDNKLRRLMYLKADVIILGYSTVDLLSFNAMKEKWIIEIQAQAPHVPILLMGAKLDRVPDDLLDKVKQKGEKTAKELGCVGFQETSSVSSINTLLFERAVQYGLMKKRFQRSSVEGLSSANNKQRKFQFFGGSLSPSNAESTDTDDPNAVRVAKISANASDFAYRWRGELVTLLMEDLLDGRFDHDHSDLERDMTRKFDLEFAVEAAGQISKKLLLFFHFLPIVNTCMESHHLQFWFEVEHFKYNKPVRDMKQQHRVKTLRKDALKIYQDYIPIASAKEINIDSDVRGDISLKLKNVSNNRIFDLAQLHVLTQLASVFKDHYILSRPVKDLLRTLKSLSPLLPHTVVDGEAETVPLPTNDGLSHMMALSVNIMTLMELLHSTNAPEKRLAKPQFIKFEDEDRVVKMGVKYLLLFAALKNHMDHEKSQENLMFWLDVEDFKSLDFGAPREDGSADYDKTMRRQLAMRATHIVRRYVEDDAEMLINLPGWITKQIKFSLAELQEAAKAAPSKKMDEVVAKSSFMFDAAQREILMLMKRDSWRRFHTSPDALSIRRILDKVTVLEEFEDPERIRMETKLHNRFDLTSDERVVRWFSCALERKTVLHGQLSITKRHLCFFSSVFGLKTTLCYNFSEILDITTSAPGSGGRRKSKEDHTVTVTTSDKQVHVFTQVVPSHTQLLYVFRKARQRLEKGHDDTPTSSSLATVANSSGDDDVSQGLTEKDWEIFKEGAEIREFHSGMQIIKQGEPAEFIFQIARGTVQIERQFPQGRKSSLRSCKEGEIIGEISFVEGGDASAAVIAESDDVVVYAVPHSFIEKAFVAHPGLPGRFYRFLATLILERLRTRKDGTNVRQEFAPMPLSMELSSAQLAALFGLDPQTQIIQCWTCAMRFRVLMYGRLYLTSHALCFHSVVLGSERRAIVLLSTIAVATCIAKQTLLIVQKTSDKPTEFINLDSCEQVRDVIQKQLESAGRVEEVFQNYSLPEDHDWGGFLVGMELKRFNKDDVIVQQEASSRAVYQLGAGSARSERINSAGVVEVTHQFQLGDMFGESSFLHNHVSSIAVIATSDATLVYVLDQKHVDTLLEQHPELPGQFYQFLASKLASQLRN